VKSLLHIEKLRRHHAVETFTCGDAALDRFLQRFALLNQQANASQTYVALDHQQIVGFYTLVVGEVAYEAAAGRLAKGLTRHPVPVVILARLATSRERQGQGIGAGLLKDAVLRTLQAASIAGIRALLVHAKDEKVAAFYAKFDFAPSPTDPLHLFALIKDLEKATLE
jgi:GNAT superfamily N-acetyltransferase